MPKWLQALIPWLRGALAGAGGFLLAEVVTRMTGTKLPIWALLTAAAVLGALSVYCEQLAEWLWGLHQRRKFKYLALSVVSFVVVIWLGWPWLRVTALFAEVKDRGPIITEKWMSEEAAVDFVVQQLRNTGGGSVMLTRARYLLAYELHNVAIGRFKCDADTTWRLFWSGDFVNRWNYDGSSTFAAYIGGHDCIVQYSTERVYTTDWVGLDSLIERSRLSNTD